MEYVTGYKQIWLATVTVKDVNGVRIAHQRAFTSVSKAQTYADNTAGYYGGLLHEKQITNITLWESK